MKICVKQWEREKQRTGGRERSDAKIKFVGPYQKAQACLLLLFLFPLSLIMLSLCAVVSIRLTTFLSLSFFLSCAPQHQLHAHTAERLLSPLPASPSHTPNAAQLPTWGAHKHIDVK